MPHESTTILEISAAMKAQMRGVSWHEEIPSPALEDLRLLKLLHHDFSGAIRTGQLITTACLAEQVLAIFEKIERIQFPIASIRPIFEFGGDDELSMAANNSTCFNSRRIMNSERLSAHAFGKAIDINPVQNPVIRDGIVRPPAGAAFLDRDRVRPGMITAEIIAIFAEAGWSWGGDWSNPRDYHHFYRP